MSKNRKMDVVTKIIDTAYHYARQCKLKLNDSPEEKKKYIAKAGLRAAIQIFIREYTAHQSEQSEIDCSISPLCPCDDCQEEADKEWPADR